MRWFQKIVTADRGHQNTLDGQFYTKKLVRLTKRLRALLRETEGGTQSVLPRWRGDIKRAILLLPKAERVGRMSMAELREVENKIAIKRFHETSIGHRRRETEGRKLIRCLQRFGQSGAERNDGDRGAFSQYAALADRQ